MAQRQRLLAATFGLGMITSQVIAPLPALVIAQTTNSQPSDAADSTAASLRKQGDAAEAKRDYATALKLYQAALKQVPSSDRSRFKARLLLRIGNVYRYTAKYDTAIPYLQRARRLYRQQKNRLEEGITLRAIGLSHRNRQRYDEALKALQTAKDVFFQQPNRYWHANAWYDLGTIYRYREEYQQAIMAYETGLPLVNQVNRAGGIGSFHYRLGQSHHSLKNYAAAAKHYQTSIPHLRQAKYVRQAINAHIQLGKVSHRLGKPQTAFTNLRQGLKLAQATQNQRDELRALYDLGWFLNGVGRPTKSQPFLKQALTLARQRKDESYEQITLGELGLTELGIGRYAAAIELFKQSLQLARKLKRTRGIQANISNLGIAYYALGDYRRAGGYYLAGLRHAKAHGDRSGEGKVNGSLGILYRVLGNYEKAEKHSRISLAIARELKDLNEQKITLLDLGLLYSRQGKLQPALESYNQVLEIAQRTKDKVTEGKIHGNLGLIYERQGNYAKAAEYMRSSVNIAKQHGDLRERGVGLTNLGAILIGLKQYDDAAKHLRASIDIWEKQRAELNRNKQYKTADRQKINLFERQAVSYSRLQQALVAQSKVEAALEVAEQARTHALVELMARKRDGSTVELGEKQNIDIARLKQIAQEQNSTIVEYSLLNGWVDITTKPGQQKQKRVVRDKQLLIWVVQPTGKVDLRQVDLSAAATQTQLPLNQLIYQSRQAIGARSRSQRRPGNQVNINTVDGELVDSPKTNNQASQELYKILIEPIQDLLPKDTKQHVVFIPQDFLFTVPFYALQDPAGRYLIDRYTIRSAPSIQVLGLTQKNQLKGKERNQALFENALIVGNPTMPTITARTATGPISEQLQPLPATEIEAKQVAKLTNSQALIGDAATKSQVLQRMRQAKLIHLATHGLLDDFQNLGIPGAIALAPDGTGKPNDGILTTDELTDERAKLQADLVVLSACDTGKGLIKGDGVIGLSRSFLAAGVPSLVVSLWAVDDASTAVLMTEFYRQLKQQPDRATALRQAMIKTREQYPDPYYWAAFSLVGQQ